MKKILKAKTTKSIFTIIFVILLANISYLFFTNPDPSLQRAYSNFKPSPFLNGNAIEPNDGYTKQALGVQAVHQILNGQFPLWNHYEGVGVPLLGETQSAATFPFTLLLLFGGLGWTTYHLLLEIIAGIGMFFFLRTLNISKNSNKTEHISYLPSTTGGCLFALIGTFAMLTNACINPVAFLPWQMLSVTLIYSNVSKKTLKNQLISKNNIFAVFLFTVSTSLSLNAGFPEIAYINSLLVFTYAVVLFFKATNTKKILSVISLAISSLLSILISLPWISEFINYVYSEYAATGGHSSNVHDCFGFSNTPIVYFMHFISNAVGYSRNVIGVTGVIGSYFQLSIFMLAVLALFIKKYPTWIRLLFGLWFTFSWLNNVRFPIICSIVLKIPLLAQAGVYRYIDSSMNFCYIVLACITLHYLQKQSISKKIVITTFSVFVIFILWMGYGSRREILAFMNQGLKWTLWSEFFILLSILSVVIIFVILMFKIKHSQILISITIIAECVLLIMPWGFFAPNKSYKNDESGIQYLSIDLGNQRIDTNVLWPNYGSYYSISQLNWNDLPAPKNLYYKLKPISTEFIESEGTFYIHNFNLDKINLDRDLGVKYIWVHKDSISEENIEDWNIIKVWANDKWDIFELNGYRQYISDENNNCQADADENEKFDKFSISCKESTKLTRLEMYYPGWHAYINGSEVQINETEDLFQQIDVPVGEFNLEFKYWPKNMSLYISLSIISMFFLFVCLGGGIKNP